MSASIQQAAMMLFRDPRRSLARHISCELFSRTATLLQNYAQCFDTQYSSVSGSTHRDTHLPNDLDFDIGLLPRSDSSEWEESFGKVVATLGEQLASDREICQCFANLYGVKCEDMEKCFRAPVEKDWPSDIQNETMLKNKSIVLLTLPLRALAGIVSSAEGELA